MDFFFRKIVRDKGAALAQPARRDQRVRRRRGGNGRLKAERAALAARGRATSRRWCRDDRLRWSARLEQPAEIYKVGQNTTRLLLALGDLVVGWLLARQAEVALAALDQGRRAGDRGVLPGQGGRGTVLRRDRAARLAAEREIAEATTLDLMELPEAF